MRTGKCTKCSLPAWSVEVPPDLTENPIFFFVGKQPGKEEATTLKPFTGEATYALRVMLKKYGIEDRCAFTNLVRCYPQNILKKTAAVNCLEYLVNDVDRIKPEVIIVLGTDVAKIMFGIKDVPDHAVDVFRFRDIPAVVVPNPAAWVQHGSNPSTEDVINLETVIELILKAREKKKSIIKYPHRLEIFLRKNFPRLKLLKLFKASGIECRYRFPKINKDIPPKNEVVDKLFKIKWEEEKDIAVYRVHPWLFELSQTFIHYDTWSFRTRQILEDIVDEIMALDFETNHLNVKSEDFRIWAVGIGSKKGVVSIHTDSNETAREVVLYILRHPKIKLIAAHNLSFELSVIKRALGIVKEASPDKFYDTQAMWHLLVEKATYGYGLKDIVRSLGVPNYDIPEEDKQSYSPLGAVYNIADVFFTLKLYEITSHYTAIKNSAALAKYVTNKLPFVIEQIQYYGMKIDHEALRQELMSLETSKSQILNRLNKRPEIQKVREIKKEKLQSKYKKKRVEELPVFNPNSRIDLEILFFDVMDYNPVKRSRTGLPSLDSEALKQMKGPIPRLIEEFRKVNKLLSTYVKPFMEIDEVHASFFVHGTTSGRLSSSGPNMQNIPPDMRKIFIPRQGYTFIELDVARAEAMMFAILSGSKAALQAIKEKDFHKWVASKIFKKSEDQITKEERSLAKTATFAILYGCTPQGLQSALTQKGGINISEKQAHKIIKAYMDHLPIINNYRRKIIDKVLRDYYIETPFNRLRRFYALKYLKESLKSFFDIHSQSVNHTVQSSLSDLFQAFVIRFFELVQHDEHKFRIVNSVHDSILIEVRDDCIDELCDKLQKAADELVRISDEMGLKLPIPIQFEMKIGKSWGEMKDFKVISTTLNSKTEETSWHENQSS